MWIDVHLVEELISHTISNNEHHLVVYREIKSVVSQQSVCDQMDASPMKLLEYDKCNINAEYFTNKLPYKIDKAKR